MSDALGAVHISTCDERPSFCLRVSDVYELNNVDLMVNVVTCTFSGFSCIFSFLRGDSQ